MRICATINDLWQLWWSGFFQRQYFVWRTKPGMGNLWPAWTFEMARIRIFVVQLRVRNRVKKKVHDKQVLLRRCPLFSHWQPGEALPGANHDLLDDSKLSALSVETSGKTSRRNPIDATWDKIFNRLLLVEITVASAHLANYLYPPLENNMSVAPSTTTEAWIDNPTITAWCTLSQTGIFPVTIPHGW